MENGCWQRSVSSVLQNIRNTFPPMQNCPKLYLSSSVLTLSVIYLVACIRLRLCLAAQFFRYQSIAKLEMVEMVQSTEKGIYCLNRASPCSFPGWPSPSSSLFLSFRKKKGRSREAAAAVWSREATKTWQRRRKRSGAGKADLGAGRADLQQRCGAGRQRRRLCPVRRCQEAAVVA
jgi:hypothetical protein